VRLEFSIEIARPRDDVFAVVSNLENDPRWQSAVLQSERVTPGRTRAGTRFTQWVSLIGKRTRLDIEFLAFEPTERYVLACVCGPLEFDTEVRFAPTRRGTELEVLVSGRPSGVLRLAAVVLSRHRSAEIEADLGNLKGLLEAGRL
jgi:uncharacterized membrane protein